MYSSKISHKHALSIPKDLCDKANIKPGQKLDWIIQKNGSIVLKKVTP